MQRGKYLSLRDRAQIALGAVKGLAYLHKMRCVASALGPSFRAPSRQNKQRRSVVRSVSLITTTGQKNAYLKIPAIGVAALCWVGCCRVGAMSSFCQGCRAFSSQSGS